MPRTHSNGAGTSHLRPEPARTQQAFECVETGAHLVLRVGGPVGVRLWRSDNLRWERPETVLVRLVLGRERHRQQRAIVKAVGECDHTRSARGGARNFNRVLDGLGATVREQRLFREGAGSDLGQYLGEADVWLV